LAEGTGEKKMRKQSAEEKNGNGKDELREQVK
jgi:hypothetical protein